MDAERRIDRNGTGGDESSQHLASYPVAKLSSSSLDDSFPLDTVGIFNPRGVVPGENTQAALMDNTNNAVSGYNPQELKERVGELQLQTLEFPVSDVVPQTQCPPIQIMQRIEPCDPLRIPTCVFDPDNPTAQVDWSNASNESLFSLHLGKYSFNRDHDVSVRERCKPAEELFKSDELLRVGPSLPIPATQTDNQSSVPPKKVNKGIIIPETIREHNHKPLDDSSNMPAKAQWENKKSAAPAPRTSVSKSSGGSGDSRRCSCFPEKKKCSWYSCPSCKCNCAWPSCHCCKFPSCSCAWLSCHCCRNRRTRTSCYSSNCSWKFCYCKRPSCNFRWLSCASCCNCGWGFCCSWECSCKGSCCHSSTVLGEEKKSTCGKGNAKVHAEEIKHSLSSPKSKPRKSGCHWLRCFSCCSCGSCSSWGSCCSWDSCCSQRSCFSWGSCCSWTSCSSCRCPSRSCHCC